MQRLNKQKIYFICPSNKFVTGGVKQIYKMVETLNENNFDAVLLLKKNRKEAWFNAKVPVAVSPLLFKKLKYSYKNKKPKFFEKLYLKLLKYRSVALESSAILVFPEIYGPRIHEIEPHLKKVIFNQNCYYTFEHYTTDTPASLYQHKNVLASIVVSEDSKRYLNFAFADHKVFHLTISVDTALFSYSEQKEKLISYMPRKLAEDSQQVLSILKNRNTLKDWKIVAIENKTEAEVAQILRKSAIFLSFNHREGFGLPPVEAMACGCFVIGYKGQAGEEYFKQDFSAPVVEGNIIQYVEEIEKTLQDFDLNPSAVIAKGKMASDFVSEKYNLENEKAGIVKIWNEIVGAEHK